MRHALRFLALALIATTLRANDTITLFVRGASAMQIAGVTAAYALDTNIADANVAGDVVSVVGRSAGTTQIVVVTAGGSTTYAVLVRQRENARLDSARSPSANRAAVDVRYATTQLQTTVEVVRENGAHKTELHATAVTQRGGRGATFRLLTWRSTSAKRELTLFDDTVDNSPLTLAGVNVRGIHLRQGSLEMHAGYVSQPVFGSLFAPEQRELAAGVSYVLRRGAGSSWTPSVYVYPGRGTVGTLAYDVARGERFQMRAEAGWGGTFGGAVQLALNGRHNRTRLDVQYRPRDFATVRSSDVHGLYADGSWSGEHDRFSADAALTISRYELTTFNQRSLALRAEGRWQATRAITLISGASYGAFGDLRSFSIPFGIRAELSRFGFSVLPRYSRNSATNEGGFGARTTAHATLRGIRLSAYADREKQAPTLELIFKDLPELALALEQLGITATSPHEIARLLRENSALINLGFIDRASVNLTPTRTQAGLEASWRGTGDARQQLRLRVLYNRNESVARDVVTKMATVSYARRVTDSLDVYSSYSRLGQRSFFELGFRQRFDAMPSILTGSATISGTVSDDSGSGVAGVELELDGERRTFTRADGKYSFVGVQRGATHSVAARLADDAAAFFTSRSTVDANAGSVVNFGVSHSPARVSGFVRSDAGGGIANVTVSATNGERQMRAVTTSDGRYTIATAPGAYDIAVDAGAVPVGFTVPAQTRKVTLERDAPVGGVDFALHANRSVRGRAPARAEVSIVELARVVRTGDDGAFAFRSLPAGEWTLVARDGAKTLTKKIAVAAEPVAMNDVTFGETPGVAPVVARIPAWIVQLGAYHLIENVHVTVALARRAGVEPLVVQRATLTFVEVGPFRSRNEAEQSQRALQQAGMEAIVRHSAM